MARVRVDLPKSFPFSTEIDVTIGYVDYRPTQYTEGGDRLHSEAIFQKRSGQDCQTGSG